MVLKIIELDRLDVVEESKQMFQNRHLSQAKEDQAEKMTTETRKKPPGCGIKAERALVL